MKVVAIISVLAVTLACASSFGVMTVASRSSPRALVAHRHGRLSCLQMSSEAYDEPAFMEKMPCTAVSAPSQSHDRSKNLLQLGMLLLTSSLYFGLFEHSMGWHHGWTSVEILTRLPIDLWNLYSKILQESPVITKACTSATVYTIGDIISQRAEGNSMEAVDRSRVFRSLVAGLIGHGPLSHFWYIACDGFFSDILHWTAWWAVFPKVVVDQLIWGTIWNSTYLVMLGLMKRESVEKIWTDTTRSTVPLLLAGLKLWPAVHIVTYGLIPVENRLLWVDFVEIFWVTILATQASGHRGTITTTDHDKDREAVGV